MVSTWYQHQMLTEQAERRSRSHSNSSTTSANTEEGHLQNRYEMEIRRTSMSEEPIGVETRTIGNRDCVARIEWKLVVSKEWTHTVQILFEQSTVTTLESKFGATVGVTEGTSIGGSIKDYLEEKVAERFEIARHEKKVCEESLLIDVPPNAYVKKTIEWKQVWQHGEVIFVDAATSEKIQSVPFRFIDKITYDVS